MTELKYVLNCPDCGRVEGFLAAVHAEEDDDAGLEPEMVIEQHVVKTPTGVTTRFRCPRCGRWVQSDRARPA